MRVMRSGLEEQLECVKIEVDDWQRKCAEESLERRKAVAHAQSLERTNKVCQTIDSTVAPTSDPYETYTFNELCVVGIIL